MANPLLADIVPWCLLDLGVYEGSDISRIKKLFVDEMLSLFWVTPCDNQRTPNSPSNEPVEDVSSDDDTTIVMSPARKRRNDEFAGIQGRIHLQRSLMAGYTAGNQPITYLKEQVRVQCEADLTRYLKSC